MVVFGRFQDVTRMPLPARLTTRPVSLSTGAGNNSEPYVNRELGHAERDRVTRARWHGGCIVYA